MNFRKLVLIAVFTAALMAVTPVYGQTATFDSVTSTTTASPGEVVSVDLVISYDCPVQTLFSPGVYDLAAEQYLAEEGFEVSGTGKETIRLHFNAPDIEGEYVFIVDIYFNNGTDSEYIWARTGQDDYYITLTVGSGGGSTSTWSAVVTDVTAPSIVKPGASFDVKVKVDYDFPSQTNLEVAISDPETGTAIDVVSSVKNGAGSDEFTINIVAPDQEGTYVLGADAVYETDNGWEFTDNGVMTFSVDVDSSASSGGISGFPVVSAVLGLLLVVGFLQYAGRKTPLF